VPLDYVKNTKVSISKWVNLTCHCQWT
jgi:hypothetical protein